MTDPFATPVAAAARLPAARRPLTLALAAVAWSGVLLQLWISLGLARSNGKSAAEGLVVYLGYFTVLTNLFVAFVLSALASAGSDHRNGRTLTHPQTMACAAASIALVGLGYHFLLRHLWNPEGLQWLADVLLHYVVPVAFCAFWLFVLPRSPLPWWSPLAWCVYPVGYFVYALIRGEVLAAYPYPFIDVAAIGYGPVLRNALGLLAVFVVVGAAFLAARAAIGRIGGRSAR